MAAVAGLLPQVDTIVSNAVSLHPQVCTASRLKSVLAVPLVGLLTDHLNPQWADGRGEGADRLPARLLTGLVRLTHHECDSGVCKFSSFTYGTGFPVLWRHENLSDATHRWLSDEFAAVPMSSRGVSMPQHSQRQPAASNTSIRSTRAAAPAWTDRSAHSACPCNG